MLVSSPRPKHSVTGFLDKVGNICYKMLQCPYALRYAKLCNLYFILRYKWNTTKMSKVLYHNSNRFFLFLRFFVISFIFTIYFFVIGFSHMTASLPLFLIALIFMPFVSAAPQTQPFPKISFKVFSMFIKDTFGPKISLAIVFLILFLITKNPELLSLYTHQQHPSEDKNKISASENLFQPVKFVSRQNHQVSVLSTKIATTIIYWNSGYSCYLFFKHYLYCQVFYMQMFLFCQKNVFSVVLTYYTDHKCFKNNHALWTICYLNFAKYVKVRQALWIDQKLSHFILNRMYNFHASASAFTQFLWL